MKNVSHWLYVIKRETYMVFNALDIKTQNNMSEKYD